MRLCEKHDLLIMNDEIWSISCILMPHSEVSIVWVRNAVNASYLYLDFLKALAWPD